VPRIELETVPACLDHNLPKPALARISGKVGNDQAIANAHQPACARIVDFVNETRIAAKLIEAC